MQAAASALDPDLTWKDIVDRGYVVAGSPATVADHLNEMADTMKVGHLMVLCQFGSMGREITMQNTARFAEEVMPKLRDRFNDWEDRWWPVDSLPTEQMARPAPVAWENA